LTTKWWSCQVEGQNNRLKALKRGMYAALGSKFFVQAHLLCHALGCTQIPPEPV
jgi:hypothetical protein